MSDFEDNNRRITQRLTTKLRGWDANITFDECRRIILRAGKVIGANRRKRNDTFCVFAGIRYYHFDRKYAQIVPLNIAEKCREFVGADNYDHALIEIREESKL